MKTSLVSLSVLLGILLSCNIPRKNSAGVNGKPAFVRVSTKYPAYFERTDGRTWVPVMINYIVPVEQQDDVAFRTIENYFRNFSENGGNSMRIWISSPFLEIEDKRAGQYSDEKFRRIDRLLALAEKYHILIKFTLHHIRTISTGQVRQPWANSAVLSADNGGPFKNIKEYINTPNGKTYYLNRAKALAERYRNNKQIFCWELWNEMDAVDSKDWLPFTKEILDSVKALFPNQMVTQTLGSLHSADAEKGYEQYFSLPNNEFVSLHRYIDPGIDWKQYPNITRPVDSLVYDAMQFAQRHVANKPIVVNEIGAVEANHAGPSKLYVADSVGILIHDMVFAPFFCGAAGTGGMWHWDSYVQRQNLWYHYQRFQNAIKGIDPVKEQFTPFTFHKDGVNAYGLKGKNQTIIWCRNTENNWKTELLNHIPPNSKTGYSLTLAETGRARARGVRVYDPWKDQWITVRVKNGTIFLPAFLRSMVVVVRS